MITLAEFVRQFDLEFAPIAGNLQEQLQSKQGQRLWGKSSEAVTSRHVTAVTFTQT